MKADNVVVTKSKSFAIRIINLYKHLTTEKQESVLSKQLLRSGTSIGANIHESIDAISIADFISKLHISLKEARETSYWLELLVQTDYITQPQFESINNDCIELIKLLTTILKRTKENLNS